MTYEEFCNYKEEYQVGELPARGICLGCNNFENRCECTERAQIPYSIEEKTKDTFLNWDFQDWVPETKEVQPNEQG